MVYLSQSVAFSVFLSVYISQSLFVSLYVCVSVTKFQLFPHYIPLYKLLNETAVGRKMAFKALSPDMPVME